MDLIYEFDVHLTKRKILNLLDKYYQQRNTIIIYIAITHMVFFFLFL